MRRLLPLAVACALAAGAAHGHDRLDAPPTPLPGACLPPSGALPPDLPGPWAPVTPAASPQPETAPQALPIVRPDMRDRLLLSVAELQGRIAGDILCDLSPFLAYARAAVEVATTSLARLDLSPTPTPTPRPAPSAVLTWTLTAASLIGHVAPPVFRPHADLAWAEVRRAPAPRIPPAHDIRILGVAPGEHGTVEAPALDPFAVAAE